MKRLLIAGCGDLGMRLSRRLDPSAWTIHGLRRHPEQLPPQIEPLKADLQDPATLAPAAGHWDAIVYQATPDERTPEAYRAAYVQGLNNLLGGCSVERLIFVSSTGVYGQDAGEWVDELAATEPRAFSGEILLEAEAVTARHGGLIVRFSGIYGPGRDFLIRSLRAGRARCRPKPPQWTNRIHSEDCAGVLAHLLTLPAPAPVYCASDSRPAPRCEVLGWLADQLGVAAPAIDEQAAGQGKRISNQRLLDSGYSFQYPDYITGYRELLP